MIEKLHGDVRQRITADMRIGWNRLYNRARQGYEEIDLQSTPMAKRIPVARILLKLARSSTKMHWWFTDQLLCLADLLLTEPSQIRAWQERFTRDPSKDEDELEELYKFPSLADALRPADQDPN
jgi:hypothetical protein